jgi:hypothetical protein
MPPVGFQHQLTKQIECHLTKLLVETTNRICRASLECGSAASDFRADTFGGNSSSVGEIVFDCHKEEFGGWGTISSDELILERIAFWGKEPI